MAPRKTDAATTTMMQRRQRSAPTIMAATAADVMTSEAPIQEDNSLEDYVVELLLPESIMKEEFDLERMARRRSSAKIQKINVTNLEGEEENEWDILRKEEVSEDEAVAKDRKDNDEQSTNDGTPANTADEQSFRDETSCATRINELPEKGQELIQVASCINSFDTKLLQACTSLPDQEQSRILGTAAEKGIVIKQDDENNGVYVFSSNEAQTQAYELIPLEKKSRFHASIGRSLVRKLSHDELETHVSIVLLQFRRGLESITSQTERKSIVLLCLRAIRWAVAESDFRAAACNYSKLGIDLLGLAQDCWKNEYDLSLALYNASAEVFHCIGDYARTDALISVVLENARCYRDTLQIRATRVHSLSSQYRMSEALEEALDVLEHLGERFPTKPRTYHILIALLRTRRLIRDKTNEAIMRMPLMENTEKVAALQILNLAFPIAYRTNPMLNGLFASRMVQLTMKYGLSAISSVGFASFSSMLATFFKNKEDAYRCSQLALDLLNRFDAYSYIPRVYYFVYGKVFTNKLGLRELCPFLLEAYHKGLETGDIQFAMIAAAVFEGYMFFSGESMPPFEEAAVGFCETAVSLKNDTALSMLRPELNLLRTLMGKVNRHTGLKMLQSGLAVTLKANDKASSCVIHFFQAVLAYVFGDFEMAARESTLSEEFLHPPYMYPGFSCLLTFHCLALLAVAPRRRGRARRKLLSKAKESLHLLEQFALRVPENCLHSCNLVRAELAVLDEKFDLARSKFMIAIGVATTSNDMMILAMACERFAFFLRDTGETSGAAKNFREAKLAYNAWGATAKVQDMEKEMPELFSSG